MVDESTATVVPTDTDSHYAVLVEPAKRRRRWPRRLAIAAVAALVVVLIAVVGYGAAVWGMLDAVPRASGLLPDGDDRPVAVEPDASGRTPLNVLILGADVASAGDSSGNPEGGGQGGTRGSSLLAAAQTHPSAALIVHIAADRSSVRVVSVPPSALVAVPGLGDASLATAGRVGGLPLVTQSVEQLVDQRIDHVMLVDVAELGQAVGAVGGIRVDATGSPASSPDARPQLTSGSGVLEAEQTESFLAGDDASIAGDPVRAANLQAVFGGIVGAAADAPLFSSLAQGPALLSALGTHLVVDDTLTNARLLELGGVLRALDVGQIGAATLPTGEPVELGGEQVLPVDPAAVDALRTELADSAS